MKILVVENFDGAPLGLVGTALAEREAEAVTVRAHEGEPLPDGPDGFDGLVVLGGAQSAVDDDAHPYLPRLAGLIRQFGDSGRAVLGICLGAQIIARAYGGQNVLDHGLQFGYRPVTPLAAAAGDPVFSAIEDPSPVFHWHQDTMSLPEGAIHLAASEQTPIQAFRIGERVYAVQFHFEASRMLVEEWSQRFAGLIDGLVPEWRVRRHAELAEMGEAADRLGLAIARRWAALAASG